MILVYEPCCCWRCSFISRSFPFRLVIFFFFFNISTLHILPCSKSSFFRHFSLSSRPLSSFANLLFASCRFDNYIPFKATTHTIIYIFNISFGPQYVLFSLLGHGCRRHFHLLFCCICFVSLRQYQHGRLLGMMNLNLNMSMHPGGEKY